MQVTFLHFFMITIYASTMISKYVNESKHLNFLLRVSVHIVVENDQRPSRQQLITVADFQQQKQVLCCSEFQIGNFLSIWMER